MVITGFESDEQVLAELGRRIKDVRIAYPLTQAELAGKAGVSLRTVANAEAGRDINMGSLIGILRALGLLANLEAMVPEQGARPSDIAKLGKKRQRATSPRYRSSAPANGWKWGDEA